MMPPLHLLIKPASGACNLRCRYCFYHDEMENREQASYGIMSRETLENLVRKALERAQGHCTFAFQGGEPTLAGLDFFEELLELKRSITARACPLTTPSRPTALLWMKAGPSFSRTTTSWWGFPWTAPGNSRQLRLDAAGKGTFQQVKRTAALFDRFGVEYNILTVVNAQTARRVQSIYNFYKKSGFRYLQFIPCLDPLGEAPGAREYSLTPAAYGEFLCRLFDLWYQDWMAGTRFLSASLTITSR